MALFQHDADYFIRVDGEELMTSRQHESELELGRLGCQHLRQHPQPRILIGGLGMGYTLRAVLETVGPRAEIIVAELLDDVVGWNKSYFAELNGDAVEDPRVTVLCADVVDLIAAADGEFDAILLDVDNGPDDKTDEGNRRLYTRNGLTKIVTALKEKGCLSVWSIEPSKAYEQRVMSAGLNVRRYRAAAYAGSKSLSRYIWVASRWKGSLPQGGGEPRVKRGARKQEVSRGRGRGYPRRKKF